jgi:hypothetical protein
VNADGIARFDLRHGISNLFGGMGLQGHAGFARVLEATESQFRHPNPDLQTDACAHARACDLRAHAPV